MEFQSYITEALVTPVRQRTQYTCVPCSLMMCLNALGMDLTEEEVNKVMGARPMQGATWEQVVAATQHFGKRATLTAPCNIEQLKEWTSRGLPVIIAYNPEGRDWSHASVVYSVSNDLTQVSIADPNMPNPMETTRVMSVEQFYKVWYEKWPQLLGSKTCLCDFS
jgi:ABC-type bacteriocin/lantibiotic exporter with double-glycine peptidase domain